MDGTPHLVRRFLYAVRRPRKLAFGGAWLHTGRNEVAPIHGLLSESQGCRRPQADEIPVSEGLDTLMPTAMDGIKNSGI
jgi:hypothetical protein